ncbi:hypothetical protein K3495_g4750 [Podosphaera aphanis]|nr:hypothetical protein K3495_g4750 [Podosphaera aphanis]
MSMWQHSSIQGLLLFEPNIKAFWLGWKESTYHQINKALADPKRIKVKTLISKTCSYDGEYKGTGMITSNNSFANAALANARINETEDLLSTYQSGPSNFAALATIDAENTLENSWILDGGSDVHICNDMSKWDFQISRKAENGSSVRAGNSSIPIEAYSTAKVLVNTPNGKKHITLENVILTHGFLTNIVLMQLLKKTGLPWSSRMPKRLEFEDQSLAYFLYQVGGHILFNNPGEESPTNTTLMARVAHDPELRIITQAKLHQILAHASPEVISHINEPDYRININRSEPTPNTIDCKSYTPEQNGAAERSGGILITKARAIGLEASLPTNLWPETVSNAGCIADRTPIRQLGWKSPFEVVTNVKPSYSHLQVFGCRAYVLDKHVPKSRKLNSRAHLGHLVGTRDVTFDDKKFYDPADLDLGNMLKESAENLIQTLDLPRWNEPEIEIEEEQINSEINGPSNASKSEENAAATSIRNNINKKINSDIDVNNIIEGKRKSPSTSLHSMALLLLQKISLSQTGCIETTSQSHQKIIGKYSITSMQLVLRQPR